MKKKCFSVGIVIIIIIAIFLMVYPFVEININGKIIKFGYTEDVSEFETNACYNESYFYNEERNVTIHEFVFKKFWFFHIKILEYIQGNICENEYVLEESYIENFIENAVIKYNDNNIDIAKLIEGKTAIVGNTKYFGNDYLNSIEYILNGEYETLYIFYINDLLVIQVGLSDEGPKYIAYR